MDLRSFVPPTNSGGASGFVPVPQINKYVSQLSDEDLCLELQSLVEHIQSVTGVEGLVDAPLLLVSSLRDKNAKLKELKAAVEQQEKELQELKHQDKQLRDLKLAMGLENLELDASASPCP